MTPTEQDNDSLQLCNSCNCMTRGNPTCGKCGAWRETETMTPTEQDNELDLSHLKDTRAVLRWCYDHGLLKGEFPTSDSSDKAYLLEQGEKRLMQLITADRKRVALEARIEEVEVSILELERSDDPRFYSKDEAIRSQRARYTHLKAQQEEV